MRYLSLIICVFSIHSYVFAQVRYQKEIDEFKKQDSENAPPRKAVLFVGSSSFRMWKDVQSAFPDTKIINRGFGGSTLADVITHIDNVIFAYEPKQIVIYCGENDIASGETPQTVLDRFDKLFTAIREKMPRVPVAFVSMKPSPSREKYREDIIRGNSLIREYLAGKKNTVYVDVYSRMLDDTGKPKSDIFLDDDLHMNAKGYAIWTDALKPVLK